MLKTALTDEVKDYVRGLGAGLVGVADPERFHGAPPGHRPQDILPGCRSVVVFAFPMLQSTFVSPNPRVWVHRYWQLRSRLQDLGYDICRYLEEEKGFYAVNLPSTAPQEVNPQTRLLIGDFSFRHAAVMAGLGEIGLNQLLVTPQYGPRVWLQAVITTAPMDPDPLLKEPVCPRDECHICMEACPQGALSPQGIDRAKCIRKPGEYGLYGTLRHIRRILEEKDPQKREELIFGPDTWGIWMHLQYGGGPHRCGECVKSCPVGKKELR